MFNPGLPILLLLLVAFPTRSEPVGSAWSIVQREQPQLALQFTSAWRDALSRLSAQQLQQLRAGAGSADIVLDGGQTLAEFMAAHGLSDVPIAIMVAPTGGGTSRGGALLVDATVIPAGSTSPNGSLVGGTLRLDPLLPGGGGTAASAQFQLTASVGQPTVQGSNSSQTTLRPGFWTPADAIAVDRVFRDGFE